MYGRLLSAPRRTSRRVVFFRFLLPVGVYISMQYFFEQIASAEYIAAIKVLRKENADSAVIGVLEDALKSLCKHYIMDMFAMASVVGLAQIEQELRNGLKLLHITVAGLKE